MRNFATTLTALSLICICVAKNARAAEFEWQSFLTAGWAQGDSPAYTDDGVSINPSFTDMSKMGITGTTQISPQLDGAIQFVARGEEDERFGVLVEWALITWMPFEGLAFRFGKQKVPTWMISNQINIGSLYPWTRPPREVYILNPFSSIVGGSVEYEIPTFGDGRLKLELFNGGTQAELRGKAVTFKLKRDSMISGAKISYSNDYLRVRGSYANALLNAEIYSKNRTAASGGHVEDDFVLQFDLGNVQFLSAGLSLDWQNIFIMAEYGDEISQSKALKRRTGWYGTAGYYLFDRKLLPHYTFAETSRNETTLFKGLQSTQTYGLNYSISHEVLVKLEWQQLITRGGKALLESDPGKPVSIWAASINATF